MTPIIRKYVLPFDNGKRRGATGFFEHRGLGGLLSIARAEIGLKKSGSPASLLRLVLPDLFSVTDPQRLHPRELEVDRHQELSTHRAAVYEVFDALEKGAFGRARERNQFSTMTYIIRQHVLKFKSARTGKSGFNAFIADTGLFPVILPVIARNKMNLKTFFIQFFPSLVEGAYLMPHELDRTRWQKKACIRQDVLAILDRLENGEFGRARGDRDLATMARIFREQVIGFYSKHQRRGGSYAFLLENRLKGLLYRRPEVGILRGGSPYELFKIVIPSLFHDTRANAIRPRELQPGWHNADKQRRSLKAACE